MTDDDEEHPRPTLTPMTRGGRNIRSAIVDITEPDSAIDTEDDERQLGPHATEWARNLLEVSRFEMARADDKANTLFRFYGVVAALSIGILAGNNWSPSQLSTLSQVFFWTGCAVLTLSGVFLGMILYPRKVRNNDRDRLLFFGHINSYPSTQELTTALAATEHDTERRLIEQLRTISGLVEHKFALMRGALIALALGTALIAGAIIANAVG
jgi:hypothetical protein